MFRTGFLVALAFIAVEAVLTLISVLSLRPENTIRDCGKRNYWFERPDIELKNLGDDDQIFGSISELTREAGD
jgi:hypothetical protein